MVHVAGRGGPAAAAGPLAVPPGPQRHGVADPGGHGLGVPHVQRQAGPGQPGAQQPGPQHRGQPARAGHQIGGRADDGCAAASPGGVLGRRRRAVPDSGAAGWQRPWPASCRHRPTRRSRTAGSTVPVTTGVRASQATPRAAAPSARRRRRRRPGRRRRGARPSPGAARHPRRPRARTRRAASVVRRTRCAPSALTAPGPVGQQPGGDPPAHRVGQRVVPALRLGAGVLVPGRRGQGVQQRS